MRFPWVSLCPWLASFCCFLSCLLFVMPVAQKLQIARVITATFSNIDDVVNILAFIGAGGPFFREEVWV